ncbi:MAG: polyprenyl synthetase family protein [candidate division WOR-3 bacterium]|nr:polyprenyl synthetase family protein [candidate division WOR-3 bacterium]MDW8150851.1 polyprenyl synthetase family protein [candidate division WOR-3 bacterium]
MKSENLLNLLREKYRKQLEQLELNIKKLFEEKVLIPEFILMGKRLRALAYMIVVKNYNLLNDMTLNLAISVELLHASSLIHDDIIDNENIRRDYPTVNKLYGNSVAVLSGDYVFIKSLEFVKNYGNSLVLDEFIRTSKNMIRGELYEELLSKEDKLLKKNYFDIIKNKTASLFEYSFSSSAIVVNQDIDKFRDFGSLLGVAYQIIDDCEDFFIDIKRGKISLPLIFAFEEYKEVLNYIEDEVKLKDIIKSCNAHKKTINIAFDYLDKFVSSLRTCGCFYEDFSYYVDYLRERSYEWLSYFD